MLFLNLFYKTIGRNYFLSSEINSKLLLILFLRFCCRLCCMRYIGICWRFLRKNFKRLRTSIVMDAQYPNVFVYNTNEFTGRLYTGVILVFLYLPPHWSHNYLLIKKFDSYCIRFRFFHLGPPSNILQKKTKIDGWHWVAWRDEERMSYNYLLWGDNCGGMTKWRVTSIKNALTSFFIPPGAFFICISHSFLR